MFFFNSERYDFWPIYDSIKKYYPLGVIKNERGLFNNYPGIRKLESIIVDAIHNESHYQNRWETFESHLENLTKKPVIGTTYGQGPSFCAHVELETIRLTDRTIFKELYFAVSLIGPFYTVIGRDRTLINLSQDTYTGGTSHLIVSPEGNYTETFNIVCAQIEMQFETYRFVPFEIATQQLEGFQSHYSDEPGSRLFHALFNHQIDLTAATVGDRFYKYSDWTKDGYQTNEGKWKVV